MQLIYCNKENTCVMSSINFEKLKVELHHDKGNYNVYIHCSKELKEHHTIFHISQC